MTVTGMQISREFFEEQLRAALRRRGIHADGQVPDEAGRQAVTDLQDAVFPALVWAIEADSSAAPWIAALCETWSRVADQRWRDTTGRVGEVGGGWDDV